MKIINFTLTLRLKTEKWQEDILDKRFEIARNIYNGCLGEILRRYKNMIESEEYKTIKFMGRGPEKNKKFKELDKKYYISEYSLHKYVQPMQHHFKENIDAYTAQKIATRAYKTFERYKFGKAKRVYFKKHEEMNSLEGKSNSTGIMFREDKLIWKGLEISVIIKKNDEYAKTALENRIKYCRILRRMIKGKHKYYIQLILNGTPPAKIDKETGEIKNNIGRGRVGIDIGTQTIAISSKDTVKLLELAPEIENIEKEKRIIQRKLDRQRRANNPNKYNKDGTIKRGNKDKWIKSNRYLKTQNQLKEFQRRQADIRRQSHSKLANYILSLGDKIYVEDMNYKGLQVRVKEITVNKKTGKYNKKKRFGKSLASKAPSKFLTILDNKLKFNGTQLYKIDTWSVKASQYNHIEGKYIKKDLGERWNDFGSYKIQRDLYSSFLIMNVKNNLKEIDNNLCLKTFQNFKILHDKEIERIRISNDKIISSMGV